MRSFRRSSMLAALVTTININNARPQSKAYRPIHLASTMEGEERRIQSEAAGALFIEAAQAKRDRRNAKRRAQFFVIKNNRRHQLIDKTFLIRPRVLSDKEQAELHFLEQWTEDYFAPWYAEVNQYLDRRDAMEKGGVGR